MKSYNSLPLFILITIFISACNITKKVPQGDMLYLGGKVEVKDKDIKKKEAGSLETDLTGLLRPKPNSSILGLRPKLWLYSMAGKSNKGLNKLLKKFGEPPVLFSKVKVDINRDIIENRLDNRGYFRASVTADTVIKGKKARMVYSAIAGPQYKINSIVFDVDSTTALGKAVADTYPTTFIKVGAGYDLDAIKAERERIDNRLKEKGFYYFSPDNLLAQVDSTNNENKVDVYLKLKDNTSWEARTIYNINNIYIFPNFRPRDTVGDMLAKAKLYKDFYVIDPRNTFKPAVFGRTMFFHKGDIYNRTDHNLSLNRLVTLGTFKFVKNRFDNTTDSAGKPALDAYYFLSPYRKKSIRAEITGRTNSANFTGSEVTLRWKNRNTFKGAELLTVSSYVGTDVQVSGINRGNNIFRLGAEANLNFPRFVGPFKFKSNSGFIPRTQITLGYDLLRRIESYTLNSFRTSLGYNWKEDSQREHRFDVIAVNYVQPSNISPRYDSLMQRDVTLKNAVQNQFTIGPIYNYNFTNTADTYRKNTLYLNGNVDLSGNVLGLIQGADIRNKPSKKFFGAGFAQYIRVEGDFRFYRKLSPGSQWANRLIVGYGYAYGNGNGSDTSVNPLSLPYVKQFFIGGTNSLRAFRARSLGPGRFPPQNSLNTNSISADQSGDIKFEVNSEWRPKLFSIVNGALFIDAGNVWLLSNDTSRPGAKFTKDFMKELAVGAGAGLRFDLSFLVLRTDLAFPLRKPWLPQGERWVAGDINPASKNWRKDNLVFNLAIGYPF